MEGEEGFKLCLTLHILFTVFVVITVPDRPHSSNTTLGYKFISSAVSQRVKWCVAGVTKSTQYV